MSESRGDFDVAILGGGLAGLTLGLQLKAARPQTSIVIAEKREGPAPEAAFKVGESTVEVSTNYFADVIGMRDHLDAEQLPKCGLRFFFPAGNNEDIALRVEYGSPAIPPVHSYQLDRGRFENELAERNVKAGNTVLGGHRVQEIELDGERKRVKLTHGEEEVELSSRWVVDAAGRAGLLKRKLGLAREVGHHVNSAWLRLAGGLDIDEWSDDEQWHRRMSAPGLRKLSTNHLCGEGYWVWLIPLASGPISIGIVADPRFHPFEQINSLDAAMAWFAEHEPQLARALEGRRDQIEDFLRVEDFAMGCSRQFSAERWCLVGEAGAFADPFYSPGSDYIAIGNTLATDLIVRDLDGEQIDARAQEHDRRFQAMFAVTLSYYEGQYGIWRNPQVMNAKITADYFYYWAVPALLFFHRKLTDLEFMAEVRPLVDRAMRLTPILQSMFREWDALDHREWLGAFSPPTAFPQLPQRHLDLHAGMDDERLRAQLAENVELYEALAITMFVKAVESLPDGAELDPEAPINPYAISLDPKRWEADGLFDGSGSSPAQVAERLRVRSFWMEQLVPRRFRPPAQGTQAASA
jgi:flavin-dependent dehydrogenase